LLIFLLILTLPLLGNGAQCNGTATETFIGKDLRITSTPTNHYIGRISYIDVTLDHYYISCREGHRVKINSGNSTVAWAVRLESEGRGGMVLSPDQTFLIAATTNVNVTIGILNSSNG